MTVKLGINPIGWTNDCMHWLGDFITLERCLDVDLGLSGIEAAHEVEQDFAVLPAITEPKRRDRSSVDARGLPASGERRDRSEATQEMASRDRAIRRAHRGALHRAGDRKNAFA